LGLNLPDFDRLDWIIVRRPSSSAALPLVSDLGAGERELLALALEPLIITSASGWQLKHVLLDAIECSVFRTKRDCRFPS
jgi:hypothetical protein